MGIVTDHQRAAAAKAGHQLADRSDLSGVGYDTINRGGGTIGICGIIISGTRLVCVDNAGHESEAPVVRIVPILVIVAVPVNRVKMFSGDQWSSIRDWAVALMAGMASRPAISRALNAVEEFIRFFHIWVV